jgi:pimeloyl-ACP methyl ester carboxylesterase
MSELTASGYAPINGLEMYFEVYGDGEMPLILIHGGGSTIETSFGKVIPLLAGKLIAVELQAHGRTSDRDAPESFEQDADDVAGLLKFLDIHKANFMGFSNGGTTTLQIAIRHAHLVNKIVAVSANYQREGLVAGFFDGMQHATLNDMPQSLQDAYIKVAADKAGLQIMFNKDKERMLNFKDIPDDYISVIKAPTLLMVADQDVITAEHVVKMSRIIPGARLAILPGTHGAFFEVAESGNQEGSKLTELAVALVEEFLAS